MKVVIKDGKNRYNDNDAKVCRKPIWNIAFEWKNIVIEYNTALSNVWKNYAWFIKIV